MKKVMLLIAMAFAVPIAISAQSAELEKWIKQSSKADNCRLSYQEGSIVINGEIPMNGKAAKQSFANSLMFFATNISSKDIFKKIDEDNLIFLIGTNVPSKSKFSKDGSRYEFSLSVMSTDKSIIYKVYNIRYVKQTGMLLSKIKEKAFEDIFSNDNDIQSSESIIKEEFSKGINYILNKMSDECPNKSYPIITHWEQIKTGKVRAGMTSEECILSWGKPSDINRTTGSWGTHEQWVYDSSYLYFENGILKTIQN